MLNEIYDLQLTSVQNFEYQIMKTGIPSCTRVVNIKTNCEGGETNCEEVLFRLQGVLTDVNLGPVKK